MAASFDFTYHKFSPQIKKKKKIKSHTQGLKCVQYVSKTDLTRYFCVDTSILYWELVYFLRFYSTAVCNLWE